LPHIYSEQSYQLDQILFGDGETHVDVRVFWRLRQDISEARRGRAAECAG
jgi:hypothetical protein